MGSLRVGHDWATSLSLFTFTLEKEMATHSNVLAWRIPRTGEPGGLPSMGSHRVGHDWSDLAAAAAVIIHTNTFCNSQRILRISNKWLLLFLDSALHCDYVCTCCVNVCTLSAFRKAETIIAIFIFHLCIIQVLIQKKKSVSDEHHIHCTPTSTLENYGQYPYWWITIP